MQGIDEDVPFSVADAEALQSACTAAASQILFQQGSRASWVETAMGDFKGYFFQLFASNATTAASDGSEVIQALSATATAVGKLIADAKAEQKRRTDARAWKEHHDHRGIGGWMDDHFGDGDDCPIPEATAQLSFEAWGPNPAPGSAAGQQAAWSRISGDPGIRIRRLPDERRLIGRRARYEVETAAGPGGRIVTDTPGRDLGALLGSDHPADLSAYTDAADLAWDGGTGQWRRGPRFWIEDDAGGEDTGSVDPVDVAAVERRAARVVEQRTGGSLVGTLPFLAAMLDRLGEHEAAEPLGQIGRDVMVARTSEEHQEIRERLERVWLQHRLADLRPAGGSLTEQAVCRLLVAQLGELRQQTA